MLALACAFAWSGCHQVMQLGSECSVTEDDEETIPPCPEAGVEDAGQDGDAAAMEEDASVEDAPAD